MRIGLLGLVFIVFLFLKLNGTIDWSWWWVTAPLWGPFALLLGIIAAGTIVAGIVGLIAVWVIHREEK
jgi:hypothetical protein